MRDLYPSLPPRDYRVSRMLRVALFSFVVATLFVSAFVVAFRWVYDTWVQPYTGTRYEAHVALLVPAILIIALVLGLRLWDASKGPKVRPRKGA